MKSPLFLTVLVLALIAGAAEPPATRPVAAKPLAQLSEAQLIDKLVEITNDEFSVRTNIFAGSALPRGLLMLNDRALTPAKAREELVRRGVAAIPELLKHLDDARKTKAVIGGMVDGITYSAEYDCNPRTDRARPAGVVANAFNREKQIKLVNPPRGNAYQVTVGDLCFNIVGDIVNRAYEAVRYQPTAIVIVNSPVLCPDLRDAVRAQWTGLTEEQHRKSLITDVVSPDRFGREQAGIYRLLHYYPQDAAAAVRKRLSVPLYDFGSVRGFAWKLYTVADGAQRKKLIDEFVAKNGAVFRDALILQLWDDKYMETGTAIPFTNPAEKVVAPPSEILTSLVGEFDDETGPMVDPAVHASIDSFIGALGDIPSPEIDQAVWETFLKYQTNHADRWEPTDRIAEAAIVRVAHKGHDAELIAFVERRLSELCQHGEIDFDTAGLNRLIRFLSEPRVAPKDPSPTDE
jgi:hypothetical protein